MSYKMYSKLTILIVVLSLLSQSVLPVFAMEVKDEQRMADTEIDQQAKIEAYMAGLHERLYDHAMDLSPLNSLLLLSTDDLKGLRFTERYGNKDAEHLCHNQISAPTQNHQVTTSTDSPHTHTAALCQQLFPSPSAGLLRTPGAKYDFFRCIPASQAAELTVKIVYLKANQATKQEAYQAFNDLFTQWILKSKSRRKHWVNHDCLKNLWRGAGVTLADLAENYTRMFAEAVFETQDYPTGYLEALVTAFVWKRHCNLADLDAMFQVYEGYKLCRSSEAILWPKPFSMEDYFDMAIQMRLGDPAEVKGMIQSPHKMVTLTLGYDRYENRFPKIIGTVKSRYDIPDPEQKTGFRQVVYSNCGEVWIYDLCNILMGNPETRRFETDYLVERFPNISKDFLRFYREIHPKYTDVREDMDLQAEWSRVVSNLNAPDDPAPIDYYYGGICDISGTGIDNLLKVFEKLLGVPVYTKTWQDLVHVEETEKRKNIERGRKLTFLLENLKFTKDSFVWLSGSPSEALENYGTVTVSYGDEETHPIHCFSWDFIEGHYEFTPLEGYTREAGWRKEEAFLPKILVSTLPKSFQSRLISSYLDLKDVHKYGHLPQGDLLHALPLLYSSSIINSLNGIVPLDLPLFATLAPYWLKRIPNDAYYNRQIVATLFNNPGLRTSTTFSDQVCPQTIALYRDEMDELRYGKIKPHWQEYAWISQGDKLLTHVFSLRDISDLRGEEEVLADIVSVTLRNEGYVEFPLKVIQFLRNEAASAYAELYKVMKDLMDRKDRSQMLKRLFEEGYTPKTKSEEHEILKKSILHSDHELTRMLLNHGYGVTTGLINDVWKVFHWKTRSDDDYDHLFDTCTISALKDLASAYYSFRQVAFDAVSYRSKVSTIFENCISYQILRYVSKRYANQSEVFDQLSRAFSADLLIDLVAYNIFPTTITPDMLMRLTNGIHHRMGNLLGILSRKNYPFFLSMITQDPALMDLVIDYFTGGRGKDIKYMFKLLYDLEIQFPGMSWDFLPYVADSLLSGGDGKTIAELVEEGSELAREMTRQVEEGKSVNSFCWDLLNNYDGRPIKTSELIELPSFIIDIISHSENLYKKYFAKSERNFISDKTLLFILKNRTIQQGIISHIGSDDEQIKPFTLLKCFVILDIEGLSITDDFVRAIWKDHSYHWRRERQDVLELYDRELLAYMDKYQRFTVGKRLPAPRVKCSVFDARERLSVEQLVKCPPLLKAVLNNKSWDGIPYVYEKYEKPSELQKWLKDLAEKGNYYPSVV